MPTKTVEDWIKVAQDFNLRTNFPNCIGAVDGKHIRIKKPNDTGSLYFNYKQYCSIVLMAVVDSEYCFTAIDVGAYGSASDSQVFKRCNFAKRLQRDMLNLPDDQYLPGDVNGHKMPYVFVGDEAFGLSKHVLRPFARKNLTNLKRIFNYRLSRARRMVECAFGILANKWRIFHRPIDTQPEVCDDIVKACCALHNYIRRHDGKQMPENEQVEEKSPFTNIAPSNQRASQIAEDNRMYFAKYFTSPQGNIPWQYNHI